MPRILLVNDSVEFLRALANLLGLKGYETATAIAGQEALIQLRDHRFDLMVLDMVMPGMTGIEVLATMPDPSPPVIVVTGQPEILPVPPPVVVRHVVPKSIEDVDFMPRLLAAIDDVVGPGTAEVAALMNGPT